MADIGSPLAEFVHQVGAATERLRQVEAEILPFLLAFMPTFVRWMSHAPFRVYFCSQQWCPIVGVMPLVRQPRGDLECLERTR